MSHKKNNSGFTLVELAIAMIIIGLLIGGVLKGQELVQNARVNATIKLVKETEAAAAGFMSRYEFPPGDVAANKITGCDATSNCVGGDENGVVANVPGGDGIAWTSFVGIAGDHMEATQFWKHLALSGFIKGINSDADPAAPAWGETHPLIPFGGGMEFYYDGYTTIGYSGHFLRFSKNGITSSTGIEGNLNPTQAFMVDRKLDDGDPDQGRVVADYGVTNNGCKNAGAYRENNNAGLCMLFITMFN